MTAYGPPSGMEWRAAAADSWLENHMESQGMEMLRDSGFEEDTNAGFLLRKLETTAPRGSSGIQAQPRMIRLAMADDLLLVLHGYGLERTDRDLVEKSFDSLRRRD